MDVALLLLIPLAAGHYFSSNWNATRYRCAREDGHRLYFRAAIAGTCLFIIAWLLRLGLGKFVSPYSLAEHQAISAIIPFLKDATRGHPESAEIVVVALITLALALVLPRLLNRIPLFGKDRWAAKAIESDDFERLLHEAAREVKPLAVTMQNNKVYIGFVIHPPDPSVDRKMIALLPLVSGYRNSKGRLRLTTFYLEIYELTADSPDEGQERTLPHLTMEDFRIVLPTDKVQSLGLFDLRAYNEFTDRGKKRLVVAPGGRTDTSGPASAPAESPALAPSPEPGV